MNLIQLVTELNRLNALLSINDGKLRYVMAKAVYTESLKVCIRRHRQALKDMVEQQNAMHQPASGLNR